MKNGKPDLPGYRLLKSDNNTLLYQAEYVPNEFIVIDKYGTTHKVFGFNGNALFNTLSGEDCDDWIENNKRIRNAICTIIASSLYRKKPKDV